jgi:hypothetical protein
LRKIISQPLKLGYSTFCHSHRATVATAWNAGSTKGGAVFPRLVERDAEQYEQSDDDTDGVGHQRGVLGDGDDAQNLQDLDGDAGGLRQGEHARDEQAQPADGGQDDRRKLLMCADPSKQRAQQLRQCLHEARRRRKQYQPDLYSAGVYPVFERVHLEVEAGLDVAPALDVLARVLPGGGDVSDVLGDDGRVDPGQLKRGL